MEFTVGRYANRFSHHVSQLGTLACDLHRRDLDLPSPSDQNASLNVNSVTSGHQRDARARSKRLGRARSRTRHGSQAAAPLVTSPPPSPPFSPSARASTAYIGWVPSWRTVLANWKHGQTLSATRHVLHRRSTHTANEERCNSHTDLELRTDTRHTHRHPPTRADGRTQEDGLKGSACTCTALAVRTGTHSPHGRTH